MHTVSNFDYEIKYRYQQLKDEKYLKETSDDRVKLYKRKICYNCKMHS